MHEHVGTTKKKSATKKQEKNTDSWYVVHPEIEWMLQQLKYIFL